MGVEVHGWQICANPFLLRYRCIGSRSFNWSRGVVVKRTMWFVQPTLGSRRLIESPRVVESERPQVQIFEHCFKCISFSRTRSINLLDILGGRWQKSILLHIVRTPQDDETQSGTLGKCPATFLLFLPSFAPLREPPLLPAAPNRSNIEESRQVQEFYFI